MRQKFNFIKKAKRKSVIRLFHLKVLAMGIIYVNSVPEECNIKLVFQI